VRERRQGVSQDPAARLAGAMSIAMPNGSLRALRFAQWIFKDHLGKGLAA